LVAEAVKEWAYNVDNVYPETGITKTMRDVDQLALEFPTTYSGRSSEGNTNALFPLAAIDGALAALFPYAELMHYLPSQWKSNVDADVMIERIKGKLTAKEHTRTKLPAKSLQHNVWDGIGVGLKFLGRLDRQRVFARE
jgi:hypothetical protein